IDQASGEILILVSQRDALIGASGERFGAVEFGEIEALRAELRDSLRLIVVVEPREGYEDAARPLLEQAITAAGLTVVDRRLTAMPSNIVRLRLSPSAEGRSVGSTRLYDGTSGWALSVEAGDTAQIHHQASTAAQRQA